MHQDTIHDEINDILDRHRVPYQHWSAFRVLAEEGTVRDGEFRTRLSCVLNYQAACEEIMELLSRPFHHLSVSHPSHFESLSASDLNPPSESLYVE